MAKAKRASAAPASPPAAAKSRGWLYPACVLGAILVALEIYGPVLHGPFVFDDDYLPFNEPNYTNDLRAWIGPIRPLLMFTYWLNFQMARLNTGPYHFFNVLLHASNAILIFVALRQLLQMGGSKGNRQLLAAFGALVFLVHPVQTESVSYVASRSENQSLFFFLAAFCLFLYRRGGGISWRTAIGVLALFGAAAATKEHTVVLPAVLVLTDLWFGGSAAVQRNWRLYVSVAVAGLAGFALVLRVLSSATTAGFGVKDFTWYQYFFTECRAIFVYLRLFVLPVGLTVDYDFPISRSLADHGAIFGLIALAAITVAAIYYRRRYPLACYGWLLAIVLFAPTSSFVPIKDPVAERRMYLPMIGLLLITIDLLSRVRANRKALAAGMAAVLVIFAIATYRRNEVWASTVSLWEDTVAKSPGKPRAHFQLAYAYYAQGRCDDAVRQYGEVSKLQPPSYDLMIDWGLAYDCANQLDRAVETLKRAAALESRAHAYAQIGMVYAKRNRWAEAMDALATAEKIDPGYAMTYVYRGGVYASTNNLPAAKENYQRALALDPNNQPAREGLRLVQMRLPRTT